MIADGGLETPLLHARRGAKTLALTIAVSIGALAGCDGPSNPSELDDDGDPTPGGQPDVTVTVDPTTQFQTITGWQASSQAGAVECIGYDRYKDTLFDLAVHDLGINRLRVPVRSGAEHDVDHFTAWANGTMDSQSWREIRYSTVNDNGDPFDLDMSGFIFSELDDKIEKVVLPMKQRLEARGEALWINITYVGFTSQLGPGRQYHHADPEEYAEFVLATHLHLRQRWGLEPDSWEILLEPDNVREWGGRRIGLAIVATAARLQQNGFRSVFIAPSTTSMGRASSYFDEMIQVPGAVDHVKELVYHRYVGVSSANLQAIVSRAEAHGIQTAMLEHIGSGHEDLHEDLKVGMNTAWQQFALAFCGSEDNDTGEMLYLIDSSDPSNPRITARSRTKLLRQYFKFVRRGAVRVGATSSHEPRVDPLAFVNTDGGAVAVLKIDRATDVAVEGLPAGTYGIKYSTENEYDVDRSDMSIAEGEAIRAAIPGRGVLTVYRR